ncbi:hypothetical protein FF125_11335 [Aureibaculum algae]|uniref:Uncharacterized protein n=1 Tax=Aureibaculum algae TaxID=2584122 RepID=A0A5B7TPX3_9FLAO|nr:hypothetical protein [Aureibaculum algae]QCX38999.1 hypothetical protein FF125_11335 [Aureibaculum algae]
MIHIKMIHLAAQYLAAAGISFLDKKQDDSHTNLGFDAKKGYLETWPLNEGGCKIVFDYTQFSLHWITNNTARMTLQLDGKTHREIVKWMDEVTTALGRTKTYSYKLHYELPYGKMTDSFVFTKPLQRELNQALEFRRIAHRALENVVEKMKFDTNIRIWPHHFDSGGYETIKNIGLGFGMAIPDTMVNDFYLYTSGYSGHDGIDTSNFDEITFGEWKNDGFKGAVLPMQDVTEAKAITFFNESIRKYKAL